MDLNKHESDRQRAGARRQTGGLQEADELESFKEELLRAIAPLELRMSPEAEAPFSRSGPVSRPGLVQRTDHDVLAAASVQRPSKSKPSKSKLLVFGTMAAIVGGVLIGVTIAAADMEQVTLADLSVTRWLAQLTSASPDAMKGDGAQGTLNDTTARAEPSPRSAQAAPTTEAAVVPDRSPSSQTTSSSAEAVQPADLAQVAAATSDHGQDGSPRKDENASPVANEGTLAASSANASSSPVAGTEDKNSELYREFMAWQASREKPQSEQRHSALPSKRPAEAHASRTHRANTANVTGNRSRSSSRANESFARSNPKDKADVAQQSSTR
jgi:hypothetical protein